MGHPPPGKAVASDDRPPQLSTAPAPPAGGPDMRVVRRLCALAAACGFGAYGLTLSGSVEPWRHPLATVLFGIGIAVLQIAPIRLSHEGQGENLYLEEAFLVPMAVHLTPAEALTAVALAVAAGQIWHRRGGLKAAFNTGEMVLAAAAGLGVSRLVGAHAGNLTDRSLLAAAVGGVVYAAISMLAVAGVISVVQRTPYPGVVRDGLGIRALTWVSSIGLGVMIAAALERRPWVVLVMALPVSMFQIAYARAVAQYNERRRIERLYEAAGSIRADMDSRRVVQQLLSWSQSLLGAEDARAVDPRSPAEPGALRATVDADVAVEVSRRIGGGPWGDNDQGLLRALASVASTALANANLFEQLRIVTISLAEGVVALDLSGRVTFANPAAERMLGMAPGSLDGKRLHDLVHSGAGHCAGAGTDCGLGAVLASGAVIRDDEEFVRADGHELPVSVTTSAVLADDHVIGSVMAFRDITDRKAIERELAHQVFHDALTGLSNRTRFADRLEQAHARAGRTHAHYGVLFIDLDRFKVVNDSLGHHAGDELLVAVADRLSAKVRPGDTFARFGGDEFVMLLEDLASDEDAEAVARRVLEDLSEPFRIQGRDVPVSASIGVAVGRVSHGVAGHALREADVAMYRAKAHGKSRFEVFRPESEGGEQERLDREIDLRRAIDGEELELHYQPVVSLDSRSIVGLEALVRWRHPERGLVPPDEFIPLAEETGLILRLGQWVLVEGCRQMKAWTEARPDLPPLVLSVNLSAHQFRQPDLPDQVAAVLAETGLDAGQLCLEVTESAMMSDAETATHALERLKTLGTLLSLDDFGTGYSSLSYLKRFPVDFVKIDRSFVADLAAGKVDTEIVRAVIRLSAAIGMRTVAEGVEDAQQLHLLREMGCPLAQGFFLSRPLPAARIAAVLEQRTLLPAGRF